MIDIKAKGASAAVEGVGMGEDEVEIQGMGEVRVDGASMVEIEGMGAVEDEAEVVKVENLWSVHMPKRGRLHL